MNRWRVMDRLIAAGADGIRGGWVVALSIDDPKRVPQRHTALKFFTDVRQLDRFRRRHGEDAPVAMDVPIGLTEEGGFRDCDREARELLGDRRSTVFAPPGRYLLEAGTTYRTVRDLVEERRRVEGGDRVPGVSAQSAALIPKIREVDHLVRTYGLSAPECFLEAHPELSFKRMNGDRSLPPKHTLIGQHARARLVTEQFPDFEDALERYGSRASRQIEDILDAYAALWTALRWAEDKAEVLGGAERDPRTGHEMRMVV
jgi:predicted RNase H-like nuclease